MVDNEKIDLTLFVSNPVTGGFVERLNFTNLDMETVKKVIDLVNGDVPARTPETVEETLEYHNLDRLFGYGFHDRYVAYIKQTRLGSSIEWNERLICMMCGSLVGMPIMHKDWHKRKQDL